MTDDAPSLRLSVAVALISGRTDDLRRCLDALAAQRDAPPFEVIVPYDPPCRDVLGLQADHPGVRFLEVPDLDSAKARSGAGREHHDTLRTVGLRAARAPYVALTEDHAVATETWVGDMVCLLDEHPRAAAIGGAVECGVDTLLNRAVYFCDFGRYQNPLPEGPARYVSDSNVAYRREALEAVADVWAGDYHETMVHDALVARGHEIWLTPRSLVHQTRAGLTLAWALRERFVWARSFAGTRVRGAPLPKRLVFAGGCALLPFLLTYRLAAGARQRGRDLGGFATALPLIFVLQSLWALGELVGDLTGDPGASATHR
jgi:hypothetical protein